MQLPKIKVTKKVIMISVPAILMVLMFMWAAFEFGNPAQLATGIMARFKPKDKQEAKEEKAEIPKMGEEEEKAVLVKALKIKKADFSDALPVMGTIKGTSQVDLRFEVNGTINSLNFREADVKKKGDLLATLDDNDARLRVKYSQSKIDGAQNAYMSGMKKLEIHQQLYKLGAIVKSKMEEVALDAESARLAAETAKVELEIAKAELEKTKLYAPRDGVIGSKNIEAGEVVTPQTKLASLISIDDVYAEVGVIEKDIEKLSIGQKAEVTVDSHRDTVFEGAIDNIFPIVEGRSRTLTAKIKVSNPEKKLLPGMFARVRIYLTDLKAAIMVPSDSIIKLGSISVIPVVAEGDIVQLRKVETGYATSDKTQITKGLREGDLVVTETQAELRDGLKVKIIETIEE